MEYVVLHIGFVYLGDKGNCKKKFKRRDVAVFPYVREQKEEKSVKLWNGLFCSY